MCNIWRRCRLFKVGWCTRFDRKVFITLAQLHEIGSFMFVVLQAGITAQTRSTSAVYLRACPTIAPTLNSDRSLVGIVGSCDHLCRPFLHEQHNTVARAWNSFCTDWITKSRLRSAIGLVLRLWWSVKCANCPHCISRQSGVTELDQNAMGRSVHKNNIGPMRISV